MLMYDPSNLIYGIFSVTAPVFAMVFVGMLLKQVRLIDDAFVATASNLVYRATIPTLLFLSVSKADLTTQVSPPLVILFSLSIVLTAAIGWVAARRWVAPPQQGVFVQAGFRGNAGIVSLALAANLYGDFGLQVGAILAGITAILYNTLSALVFSACSPQYQAHWGKLFLGVLGNPMVLGVLFGVAASLSGITLPLWVEKSGLYFASLSLPLALICVGAALSLAAFRQSGAVALHATLVKLIWSPLLFTTLAWAIGIQGRELGILFLFLATPTAAVSYVMARLSGGDSALAANIIVLTTLAGMPSIMLGLYILQYLGLI